MQPEAVEMPDVGYTQRSFNRIGAANLTQSWEPSEERDKFLKSLNTAMEDQQQNNTTMRRNVKIIIADPHPDIPLDKCVLMQTGEFVTDSSDQELFFELPITEMLKRHNELRVTVNDKEKTNRFAREMKLEPARVRDLKMIVDVLWQLQ